MECRKCGACCIALSISSAIPGMPGGKPAGVPCLQLTDDGLCALFESADRPAVCSAFPPMPDTCGRDRLEALHLISQMERATDPN
ncbi:MAG TPA: YkgJ family cysteine cluster protein [Candidatus Anoxymicrobiaceae bacterium]